MSQSVLGMAKDLVLAQIQEGSLSSDDVHDAINRIYQRLLALKSREESDSAVPASASETPRASADWRKSITRYAITCLECGQAFQQLSRHLRQHDLEPRSYRAKYGIPQNQPLAARETTAKRRQIAAEVKPWEKAPAYVQAQEAQAAAAKKSERKKVSNTKRNP